MNSDKFYPSPTTSGVILNKTNCANGSSNGDYTCTNTSDTYTISIGARANYTQPAGVYSNTYILTAIGNYPTYTIKYIDSITGDTLSTSTADSTTLSPDITLSAAPTKDNYDFNGWCSVDNSTDPSSCKDSTGTAGTTYAAGSSHSLALGTATANVNNFYAIWKSSKIYMWNATSADCGKTMYDNRDGIERAYTTKPVVSLCWMTTNLMLGKDTATRLTSDASNVRASGYTLPISNTTGFSGELAVQKIYSSNNIFCDTSNACYGYYTYAAATSGVDPSSGASSYDICPANWRLPTFDEFLSLKRSYGTGALLEANWAAAYAGFFYGNSLNDGGNSGSYWSSTASSATNAQYLYFYGSSTAIYSGDKNGGYAIRCVAKS